MLRVEQLKKEVKKRKILHGVSFSVGENEILGLTGPKGAGKTTLIKILAGLLEPTDGSVFVDEEKVTLHSVSYKRSVGYMPENFLMYANLKVGEYMDFYSSLYEMSKKEAHKRKDELLCMMKLKEKEDDDIESLTKGMRKKLSLARCLIHDPTILLLDEPTAGIDFADRYEMLNLIGQIANMGKHVIVTSPIMSELSGLCSSLSIIHEGKILLSGTVEQIQSQIRLEQPIKIKVLSEEDIPLAADILKKNAMTERISMKKREIQVIFGGNPQEEQKLLTQLTSNGVKIQSFVREEGNLENLFLELMKENDDAF